MSRFNIPAKFQINDKHFAPKEKISREWYADYPQRYSGDTFQNNIHGNGFYFINKEEKQFYDGLFYANKLEGYSQIFYGDGSHFQGLFKDNKRLGPGVFTYPNDEQDIGLWDRFSLARLETVIEPNVIPRLGNTAVGKVKLLKYRYLVPVCPEETDIAEELLTELGANSLTLNNSNKLYNLEVENKNNIFFDKKAFDAKFYPVHDCSIDILITEEDGEEEEPETAEVGYRPEEEQLGDGEECPKGSPIDTGRIHQISDELESIEYKIKHIRRTKHLVSKKVEYCKSCCYDNVGNAIEEEVSVKNLLDVQDFHFFAKAEISGEHGTSFTTSEHENDSALEKCEEASAHINVPTFKIEDYLMDTCDCHEEMHIGDLDILEKQLEALSRDEIFYEALRKSLQKKLKYHLKKSEECTDKVKTKQVVVNELLAWNNEELSMNMLKHSFLHRRSEYMVLFSVSRLLKGKRDAFGEPAANGKSHLVPILVNFGAKLDQVNDEGLTPLSLCFLIYLAVYHNRFDWENSFLPELNLPPDDQRNSARKWNVEQSQLRLNQDIPETSALERSETKGLNKLLAGRSLKQPTDGPKESYVFDTSFKVYQEPKKAKGKGKAGKKGIQPPMQPVVEPATLEFKLKARSLKASKKVIDSLLEHGANPNIGEVPLPPLLLAVFSENEALVRHVLARDANVNVTIDEGLTSLHVIASLRCCQENVDILTTLLEFDAQPNTRTNTSHWLAQKTVVLGKSRNVDEYDDNGKNPLHILCLRRDFPTDTCGYFENIATMLILHEIEANDTYLGHTPLSLAVLAGNFNLVQIFLKMVPIPIDPHRQLEYGMGNVLTLFILKRYDNCLPLEKASDMLKLLVEFNVNPLGSVGDFENAIAFMDKEHEVIKVEKGKGKKGKKDKKKSKSSKGSKKSKKGKKGKVPPQEVLKEYLKSLARDTIIKYIQLEAVKHLYNLAEAGMMNYGFTKVLAEFLTPPVAIDLLTALFNRGTIKTARFDKEVCLNVLEFVEKYQKVVKVKKPKKDKGKKKGKKKDKKKDKKSKKSKSSSKSSSESGTTIPEPPPPTFSEILDTISFKKLPIPKNKPSITLLKPGLDNTSKYMVCFHCLRGFGKALLLCPRCQYVYYCSEQCNKLNIKMKAQHSCNINFYKAQKQRLDSGDTSELPENIHAVCKAALERCELELIRRQQEELESQRRREEEERRLDIYGTRFLGKRVAVIDSRRVSVKTGLTLTSDILSFAASLSHGERKPDSKSQFEARLTRLSLRADKEDSEDETRASLKGLDKTCLKDGKKAGKKTVKKAICKCLDQVPLEKAKGDSLKQTEIQPKAVDASKKAVIASFETAEIIAEPEVNVRKLRKIPSKYQDFIELLGHYFPDVDFSFLFLPYACYSNGQLYYNFLDENIFTKTYSLV